jgi:hypothetical protein
LQTPKYFELVTGHIGNRNAIVNTIAPKDIENKKACYRSLWNYTEDFKKYVERTGSVEDYVGIHDCDFITFDFDSFADPEQARKDALQLIRVLTEDIGVDYNCIHICFSGSKGFHILLPIALIGSPEGSADYYITYKKFIESILFKFAGITYKTADLSIYNPMRIFRIANTIHEKTGFYKIPLDLIDLQTKSINDIRELAKLPRYVYNVDLDVDINPYLEELWYDCKVELENKPVQDKQEGNIFVKAISEPAKEGERHEKLIKIAGYLIDKGVPYTECMAIIKKWNEGNSDPLSEARLVYDLKGAYKSFYNKKPKIEEPTLDQILVFGDRYTTQYDKHIARISKYGRMKTGYSVIDDPIRGMIAGEVMVIVGKTSVGKSAFAQNIALNNNDTGRRVLFFSLEMPIANVAERSLQMIIGKSGREIEREKLEGLPFIDGQIKEANERLQNFITVPIQGIHFNKLEYYIKGTEDYFGEKLDMIIIDYAGLIEFDGGSLYEQQTGIAKKLKQLSGSTETGIITLAQVSKNYKDTDPLDLDSTRDSGVVTEACDYLIGWWRANREHSKGICLDGSVIKNRNGSRVMMSALMDRISLRYTVTEKVDMDDYNTSQKDEVF